MNFSVGMLTPPVGLNLFVAMGVSKMSLRDVLRGCLPFIAIMIVALILITYVPWITLWLPDLIYAQ